jgi:hypothetical protein
MSESEVENESHELTQVAVSPFTNLIREKVIRKRLQEETSWFWMMTALVVKLNPMLFFFFFFFFYKRAHAYMPT